MIALLFYNKCDKFMVYSTFNELRYNIEYYDRTAAIGNDKGVEIK